MRRRGEDRRRQCRGSNQTGRDGTSRKRPPDGRDADAGEQAERRDHNDEIAPREEVQVQPRLARGVAQRDRDTDPGSERDQRPKSRPGVRGLRPVTSRADGQNDNGEHRDPEKNAIDDLVAGDIPEQPNKTRGVRRRQPRVRRSVTEEVGTHRDHGDADRRHTPRERAGRATQTHSRVAVEAEQGRECDHLRREHQRAEEVCVDGERHRDDISEVHARPRAVPRHDQQERVPA